MIQVPRRLWHNERFNLHAARCSRRISGPRDQADLWEVQDVDITPYLLHWMPVSDLEHL